MLQTNRGKFIAVCVAGVVLAIVLFAFGQWSAALVLLVVVAYVGYLAAKAED